ncbi:MAG TPA: DUF296 domain-containing protein [Methanosarcinales archaeon]|nr:DUF296 domain-containing protein [Methanosarcinales archaeon]
MEYQTGCIGRVFVARIDHGEDLIAELIGLARLEGIRQAFFILIGAVRDLRLVTGPKEDTVPPDPVWSSITEVQEILGVGNILWNDDTPAIHLHAALGRDEAARVGCLRERVSVYLTVEVFIIEMIDMTAAPVERIPDAVLGIARMSM